MEFLFDFIIEMLPDAFLDFLGEKMFKRIKTNVPNRFLRGCLYVLLVIVLPVLIMGLAFGLLLLIGRAIF